MPSGNRGGSKATDGCLQSNRGGVPVAFMDQAPAPAVLAFIRTVNQQFYRRHRAILDLLPLRAISAVQVG